MAILKAVRGTRDLLPPETELWNRVEATAGRCLRGMGLARFGRRFLRRPSCLRAGWARRRTSSQKRCIRGRTAGALHSEKGQSLTLRPENTAGVVRAYIEHKLGDAGMLQKLFYIGPQFRRERPQRGRYRQFWQIGAEVIGPASVGCGESRCAMPRCWRCWLRFWMSWA